VAVARDVFHKDELVIGRGERGDIALLAAEDVHARLVVDADGQAWITNLSDGGTWINGREIDAPTRLDLDDELSIAGLAFGGQVIKLAARPIRSQAGRSIWQVELVKLEAAPANRQTFTKDRVIVGGAQPADLELAGQEVSTPHCALSIDQAARIEVTDLGSEVGTSINGSAITGPTRLGVTDVLRVGQYLIRLAWAPQWIRPSSMYAWRTTLQVQRRGQTRGELPPPVVFREERLVIGRHGYCDIVLPSGNVSKRHCHVSIDAEGIPRAHDHGSCNGTFLNGSLIRAPTPMGLTDRLYVGDFVITLVRLPEYVG
jgi:predicted component of type VI protein secretion system